MEKIKEKYETRAFRLKKEVIDELNRLSDLDHRTLVNYVGLVLENHIKSQKQLSKTQNPPKLANN